MLAHALCRRFAIAYRPFSTAYQFEPENETDSCCRPIALMHCGDEIFGFEIYLGNAFASRF
jgi:hypothetical protein